MQSATRMKIWSALAFAAAPLLAADTPWPQFRGPDGSGVAEGQKPVVEFGPEKNLLWRAELPSGASSPIVTGDYIITTGFDGAKLFTICLRRSDGRELWRVPAPAEQIEDFHAKEGSPAASTPATDGERVVVYFGSCGLLCYDLAGKELWRVPMPVAQTNNRFGSGTSPILVDGRVYLVRDLQADSALFCFDAATGKQLWKIVRDGFPTGWSTPLLWRRDGQAELVVGGALRLKAYDPSSGAERWTVRNLSAVNCTTPVAGDGLLYFGGWSPGGEDAPMPEFSMLLQADADGDGALSKPETAQSFLKDFFESNDTNKDGKITRDEWDGMVGFLKKGQNALIAVKPGAKDDATESGVAWRATRGLPYVPSPLFYRGRIYLLKDGGLASCYEAKSGAAIYTQTRLGVSGSIYTSPVAADGRIYGATLEGIAFAYAAGEKPELLAKVDLGERISATPAIAGNTLYYRSATRLWAFGTK
jgi:outer membrane protein assembly factor BamB